MNKKLLCKIPVDPFPVMEVPLEYAWYLLTSKVVSIDNEDVLVTTFHDVGKNMTHYRVFSTKSNFITEDLISNKWLTSMVEKLVGWHPNRIVAASKTDNICGSDFYGYETNTLQALIRFQGNVRCEQLKKRRQKEENEIDATMKKVPDLPKNFDQWLIDVPLKGSRYIYYKRKGKKIHGYCTHCKRDVIVDNVKHNRQGTCPSCASNITYKSEGKSKNVGDTQVVSIAQKGKGSLQGHIIVRYFNVNRIYGEHYKNPIHFLNEVYRLIISEEKTFMYEYCSRWSRVTGKKEDPRWHRLRERISLYTCHLYTHRLENTLKGTKWEYCQIKEYALKKGKINAVKYLEVYLKYPEIEYLSKLGLYNLLSDAMHLDHKRVFNTLSTLSKKHIPLMREVDAYESDLNLFVAADRYNIPITRDTIVWTRKVLENRSDLHKLAQYMTFEQAINYLTDQYKNHFASYNSLRYMISDWLDYLVMCKDLEYNLKDKSILFPKNMKESHDRASNILKTREQEHLSIHISNMKEDLIQKYWYENDEYIIVVPNNVKDFIEEGNNLHHCVATYVNRVVKKQCVIVFIRKKESPDKSLYTAEIVGDKIVQLRSKYNKSADKGFASFIHEWNKAKKLQAQIYLIA